MLTTLLWSPGPAGRAAAYALDSDEGLALLLRGVLTGAELVKASAADDSWQELAGHSIDAGEAAACRRRAVGFLEAAAAAASGLLQHLRGSDCAVKSKNLMVGLIQAHAALCCQEESLACMLGGSGGPELPAGASVDCALLARYHLGSALRCYVETAQQWQVRIGTDAISACVSGWLGRMPASKDLPFALSAVAAHATSLLGDSRTWTSTWTSRRSGKRDAFKCCLGAVSD